MFEFSHKPLLQLASYALLASNAKQCITTTISAQFWVYITLQNFRQKLIQNTIFSVVLRKIIPRYLVEQI